MRSLICLDVPALLDMTLGAACTVLALASCLCSHNTAGYLSTIIRYVPVFEDFG